MKWACAEHLPSVTARCAVVVGEADQLTPVSSCQEARLARTMDLLTVSFGSFLSLKILSWAWFVQVVDRLPSASLHVVPLASHQVMQEQHEAVRVRCVLCGYSPSFPAFVGRCDVQATLTRVLFVALCMGFASSTTFCTHSCCGQGQLASPRSSDASGLITAAQRPDSASASSARDSPFP